MIYDLWVEPEYQGTEYGFPGYWFSYWYHFSPLLLVNGFRGRVGRVRRVDGAFYVWGIADRVGAESPQIIIPDNHFREHVQRRNISDAHVNTLTARLRAVRDMTRHFAAIELLESTKEAGLKALAGYADDPQIGHWALAAIKRWQL